MRKQLIKPNRRRSASKLNAQTTDAICEMIRRGLSLRRAGEALGIHHSTIGRWREERADFASAVVTAEAQFVQNQLATIRKAAVNGSWQAAAWMLERRLPAEFSQPQIQLTQKNLNVPCDELDQTLARLRASPAALASLEQLRGPVIEARTPARLPGMPR
jgi:hypothetical protein